MLFGQPPNFRAGSQVERMDEYCFLLNLQLSISSSFFLLISRWQSSLLIHRHSVTPTFQSNVGPYPHS